MGRPVQALHRAIAERMRGARIRALLAAGAATALGCEDSTPPSPNIAPDTFITSQVPTEGSRVPHHIQINWRGADIDGTPAYFQYILEDYPPSVQTYPDVVAALQVPAPNDPRWAQHRVNANRTDIRATADILHVDPRTTPPPLVFDRWHTFFVRAIDNEGAIDETPGYRSFQAYTEAPVIQIGAPAAAGQAVTLPRTIVLNWDGLDHIGSGLGSEIQSPLEARWVKLRATLDGMGQPIGFPDSLYNLMESRWSPWADWNTGAGRSAVLRDLVPVGTGPQAFVIAVQGRDDGGATTQHFDNVDPSANNYAVVVADGTLPVGPRITVLVRHATVDTLRIAGNDAPPMFTVLAAADTVTVSWTRPDASRYGAGANDTRYGWNITNPDDDLQWTPWGTTRSALPRSIGSESVFRLQARDDLPAPQQVTSVAITVRRVARVRRP